MKTVLPHGATRIPPKPLSRPWSGDWSWQRFLRAGVWRWQRRDVLRPGLTRVWC